MTIEEQFSEEFADFYTNNVDHYGDSEEGLEDAYNDFVELLEEQEDNYGDEDSEMEAFSEFYSELSDIYGDSEEGLEEAYADFIELQNAENGTEEEFSDLEQGFMEFYSDMEDVYGDTEEGIEEAYADYIEALEEEMESEESNYSEVDEDLLEDFADFYADTEDIYGDDVESAFDDYADALEALANEYEDEDEEEYEDEYGDMKSKFKDLAGKVTSGGMKAGGTLAGAGYGAVTGGVAGLAIAALTQKDKAERNSLIAKVKAGTATNKDKERLAEINKKRSSRLKKGAAIGAGAGLVAGGAGGYYTGKKGGKAVNELVKGFSEEDDYSEDGKLAKAGQFFKNAGSKIGAGANTNVGRTVIGAGLGVAVGAMTDKNSSERKALKAKVKAGTATAQEKARLTELQKDRRNRLMKAGAIGGVAGLASKGVGNMVENGKLNKKLGLKSTHGAGTVFKETYIKPKAVETASSDVNESQNDKSFADLGVNTAKDRDFSAGDKRPSDAGTYVTKLIQGK